MDEDLIGLSDMLKAAMSAAIDADKEAAENYDSALKEYAYKKDENGKVDSNSLDFFKMDITDAEGGVQTVSIPKISMMPMPLLHITEASFDIEADLELNESSENKKDESVKGELKEPTAKRVPTASELQKMQLQLRLRRATARPVAAPVAGSGEASASSSQSAEKSMKTNLKISVKMEQSDLPAGLGVLLQTIANNTKIETR
ncbi:MAG: DUF2589 domain-containing protein [Bacteroidales bacterium]|nr:DUF2589 domain-containing protein [Bacteroidales bacterium]